MTTLKSLAVSVVAVAACFSSSMAAAEVAAVADSVIFSRTVSGTTVIERIQSHYPWGWQTLPRHQNPANNSGYLHLVGGVRPTGVSTQWVTFNIKSNGLFTNANGAHIAVFGRHESAIARYNRGRGFTIGATPGCAASPSFASTQGEIWFDPTTAKPPGTRMVGDCMPNAMKDNTTYRVVLHVSDTGYAYKITDAEPTSSTYNKEVVSKYVPVANDGTIDSNLHVSTLGGYAMALVSEGSGTWSLAFSGIASGWF